MNAEGTKRLALIKSLVEEQGADGDKRWIIDQLVVSEATCQSLREQSSRWEAQALEAGVRIAELEALFALQQTRMAEATHMWQEATGKQDLLPDLGDLLAWLMVRLVELEALEKALHCSWCGSLSWTALKWGRIVHKSACPHRLEPYHQGAPPDRYPEKPQEVKP